jgi:hypothetical protein
MLTLYDGQEAYTIRNRTSLIAFGTLKKNTQKTGSIPMFSSLPYYRLTCLGNQPMRWNVHPTKLTHCRFSIHNPKNIFCKKTGRSCDRPVKKKSEKLFRLSAFFAQGAHCTDAEWQQHQDASHDRGRFWNRSQSWNICCYAVANTGNVASKPRGTSVNYDC